MKKILAILLCVSFMPFITSCGESKAEREARLEQERQWEEEAHRNEAKHQEREKEREQKRQEMEAKTFTTSKGRFLTQEAIQSLYNQGLKHGAADKSTATPSNSYYHFSGAGTEKVGKSIFVDWYGIPSDEKAKEVCNEAIEKYISGYKEGYNF